MLCASPKTNFNNLKTKRRAKQKKAAISASIIFFEQLNIDQWIELTVQIY